MMLSSSVVVLVIVTDWLHDGFALSELLNNISFVFFDVL